MPLCAAASGICGGVLAIGAWGCHSIAGLDWIDGFLDAAMILSGEGPVSTPPF
jgi:hypothetical protein